ncbi:TolC family protein, partial [Helicobacter japonicus]|uniref:TolC family protein n=1 Tax=Helicobacter japonicus TaxID=425400 RepID=UPI003013CFB1
MKRIVLLLGFFSLLNAQEYTMQNQYYNIEMQNETQDKESTNQSVGRVFTLVELLDGAKKNYNLEAKDLAILQAKATSRAAYGEFLPTLDGAYQYQDTDNPSMRLKTYTGSIKGNWEIFSGFKTYNKVREKGSLYRASIEDREHTKDQLFLNVIEQYYGYFTNRAQLLSLDQKRTQLESNIRRVERLFSSGLTTIDDVESLRAELLATQHDIENINMEIERNKLMLSLLANTEVQELERKEIKAPIFKLDENRHDLNMLNFQALSAKYQARQINYLPIVSIRDTYVVNSDIKKAGALTLKDTSMGSLDQMLP